MSASTTITVSELLASTRAVLDRHALSLDEFLALGRTGRIEDHGLRDLWLAVGPPLSALDPDQLSSTEAL